jgi:uncharacterized protein YjiK
MLMRVFFNAVAFTALASFALGVEPLGKYTHFVTYPLHEVNEASGITYNWDTGTLFAIGDEGEALVQVTKTGGYVDEMGFDYNVSPREARGLDDAEGVAYLGNNTFIIADERDFQARAATYEAGVIRTKAYLTPNSYSFDYTGGLAGNNVGLEDLAYDPVEKAVWGVKESTVLSVFRGLGIAHVPGNSGVAFSVSEPIARREISRWETRPVEAPLGVTSASGIYALAASKAFPEGHPRRMNLLLLARDRRMLLEVTRTGAVVDHVDISGLNRGTIEGLTMDDDGVIYLASEQTSAPNNFSGLHVLTPPVKAFAIGDLRILPAEEGKVVGEVKWDSAAGESYVIEHSENLDLWIPASDPIPAAAEGATTLGTTWPMPKLDRGFFRVKKISGVVE